MYSRKRFRPLDPAEERSVHTGQALHLGLLDDERSYCFSWPEAPLSIMLKQSPVYMDQLLNGNVKASDEIAVTADNALVAVPCVYNADCLQQQQQHRLSSPTACSTNTGAIPTDVDHLLHAMLGPSTSTASSSSSCCIRMLDAREQLPSTGPHPLAPPRPHSTTEDSIFSLNTQQLADVTAAGLLRLDSSEYSTDATTTAEPAATQQHRPASPRVEVHGEPPLLKDAAEAVVGHSVAHDDDDAETLRQRGRRRRLLEAEVVGLEWRAFHQSTRTAAALQRLLSLADAVPFQPSEAEESAAALKDDRRYTLYQLWLTWRLQAAAASDCSGAGGGGSPSSPSSPLGPSSSSVCASWGSPLIPGAFLYSVQQEYFLSPQSAPGTAALQQLQQQQQQHAAGGTAAGRSVSSRVTPPEWSAGRRRGPYSFLRWKIELYTARRAGHGNSSHRDSDDKAKSGSAATTGGGVVTTSNAYNVLSAADVDALVRKEVLAAPLVEVSMDTQTDGRAQQLECGDLREDVATWSMWLSKMF